MKLTFLGSGGAFTLDNYHWDNLKVTVTSIQNRAMNFEDYFNVHPLNYQLPFAWDAGNQLFHLVRVPHIHDGFVQMWSYGLFFEVNGKKVYISTDCQGVNSLAIATANFVFQDCETSQYKSGVHTNYADLKLDIPDKIRKNVWLYHYNDGPKPDAVADGFAGFVELGQSFEF